MTALGPKVAHVRRVLAEGGANTGDHHCHWPGCKRQVAPAAWGCLKHWRLLPQRLRRAIWAAYRVGQEDSKTPSRAYVDVAREVQEWIARNHPPKPSQGELL